MLMMERERRTWSLAHAAIVRSVKLTRRLRRPDRAQLPSPAPSTWSAPSWRRCGRRTATSCSSAASRGAGPIGRARPAASRRRCSPSPAARPSTEHGVRFTTIMPGVVDTAILDQRRSPERRAARADAAPTASPPPACSPSRCHRARTWPRPPSCRPACRRWAGRPDGGGSRDAPLLRMLDRGRGVDRARPRAAAATKPTGPPSATLSVASGGPVRRRARPAAAAMRLAARTRCPARPRRCSPG